MPKQRRLGGVTGVCAAVVAACGLFPLTSAAAGTITVNTTATTFTQGDGLCSLAEAVDYSDGGSDADCSTTPRSGTTTIKLPAGRYTVPDTLEFDYPTDVVGAGAATTDIDGGGVKRVLNLDATTVAVTGVTISGGLSPRVTCTPTTMSPCAPENGEKAGGIDNFGNLTLTNVIVSGNHTAEGATGSYALPTLCIGGCPAVAGPDGGDGGQGAGIYNETGATLTINDSSVSNNQTGAGSPGGVGVSGSGTAASAGQDGGVGGDGGQGAGIYNETGATLTVENSTISGNSTGAGGTGGNGTDATANNTSGGHGASGGNGGNAAGIANYGTLVMTASTLADNKAGAGGASGTPGNGMGTGASGGSDQGGQGGSGAGLLTGTDAATTLLNTTLAGNVAGTAGQAPDPGLAGGGGAIDNLSFTGTTLTHVTIAGNSAGEDAALDGPGGRPLTETDSIIASNTSTEPGTQSCNLDQIVDGGHNVAFGAAGCPGVTGDPRLGALASNGGPTQTLALKPGSSAIDLIPASACGAATDQRGIGRPQGGGCDAGAYEAAPPVLTSAKAVVNGPESASVSGSVAPNLTDTKLVVRYGTTTAYRSRSVATDAGSGLGAAAFTIPIRGLRPRTTYHAEVVATNTDGDVVSNTLTFTTPVALTAAVRSGEVKGSVVSVRLVCRSGGVKCSGALTLTSRITSRGGNVVAVAASGALTTRTPKRRTTVRTVGGGRYSIAAGKAKVVKLSLNKTGKQLLRARRRLPALLEVTGSANVSKRVTFIYRAGRAKKRGHT
jgi:hypothetical protein